VTDWGAAVLGGRDRDLLIRRDPGALQIAAKGVPAADLQARPIAATLLTSRTAARELVKAVRRGTEAGPAELLGLDGPQPSWPALAREVDATLRRALYPWTGFYLRLTSRPACSCWAAAGRRPGTAPT